MNKSPKTFSEQFCIEDAGMLPRAKRNLKLIVFLFMTFVKWFQARKVREEFRLARENNRPFYVDRFGPQK